METNLCKGQHIRSEATIATGDSSDDFGPSGWGRGSRWYSVRYPEELTIRRRFVAPVRVPFGPKQKANAILLRFTDL